MPINKNFATGTVLFRENDRSRELYIIQTGRVKVYRTENHARIDICELGKGGIVGEMSLLDGRARSASVEAIDETVAAVITPEEFERKTKQIPEWFLSIIRILCTRLREVDRRLKNSLDEEISANVASLLSMLMNKRKKKEPVVPPPLSADPLLTPAPLETDAMPDDTIDLKFAKSEIMEILSLSHPKVVAALTELENNKLINLSNNRLQVPDKRSLDLYSAYKRGVDMDHDISLDSDLSENALTVLKLLYYATRPLKPDKNGGCEIPLNALGPDANKLFAEGDFLKELSQMDVVGFDEKSLLEPKGKETAKILINRRKIASILAAALFGRQ